MSGTEIPATQGGGSNASEFVRKLYRMLEDPSHQDVARWGKGGDTFVVVEGEKFTRSILPKHFKHSNMSSFIRQLNKYDFHKVKPSSDSENSSPLGNVLEFKHPFFKIDSKDDLDNIRRKAPAPRKPQAADDYNTSQHINVVAEQLAATQQQVQQLQELYTEVLQTNKLLVTEVLTLQKIINAQRQASHEIVNYLTPYDGQSNNNMMGQPSMTTNGQTGETDEVVPELRRARELLSSVNTDAVTDRELERLHNVYGSPTDSGAMVTPTSLPMMNDPMHDITRYPVYPVGQTVGIDPFHSDHIHKIPYAVPNDSSATAMAEQQQKQHQQQRQQQQVTQASSAPPAASAADKGESIWGTRKPRVLLVEDDPTCTKIGVKFLRSMGCEVEHAHDGAEAYARITNSPNREPFDMIFMDIIMPRMDGVSATMYIRHSQPAIPIIAMTSNIRPEEVNGYFEHGMNGVLAKPFTRDGMWKSVRTHLGPLMKNPPPEADIGSGAGYHMGSGPYLNTAASIKLEGASPNAAGSTWSPNQIGQNSMGGMDQGYGFLNGSNQYSMATGHRPVYATAMHTGDSTSGRASEVDSPPEKRQRLNQSAY